MLSVSASNQFIPMGKTRNTRSVKATEEGLQKLIKAKAAQRNYEGRTWTDLDIATAAGVSDKTVQRFFDGIGVDKASAIAIVQALGLEITEVVDPKDWNPAKETSDAIDWHEVCGKVLGQQREEQRLRRQATERGFELNVYVPVGLVERKQQQRRRGDVPLEEVYQLTEEVITKEYDNNKFLTEVIEPGKSRRIAIIGEPGAGKTTLQEKIAVWLHDKNKGLPICIPLGGLQGKSIEDYLLQIWLKAALRFIEPDASGVEAQAFASLQKQFREGKVWLLLDGVDEMAATSPVEALTTIKEQLTDWLVEARVVLTCRLNVWDANVTNLLTGFETYRTLEFKPEQVEDFIRQWFACAEESQRGEELLRKLQETGRERIRELVRNPLRLSLLCQTSYVLPVDEPLPETKAALYERFTRYFYEWKQEQHPTTRTERRQLNQALGELAKAGINSTVRFRLGEDFACDVMGEPLFDLACRLGWLNLVDREANTDEAVYAFFHPTFQEYFAACAIDDWYFFLNHVPDNPMQGNYRIFERQWKEVILLWLGRNNVPPDKKEAFIWKLLTFEDKCQGFYWVRAYFVAAEGIAEFRFSFADGVLALIIQYGFGFDIEKETWTPYFDIFEKDARLILKKTDYEKAVKALKKLLKIINKLDLNGYWKSAKSEIANWYRHEVSENLYEIHPESYKSTITLLKLIQTSRDNFIIEKATETLRKFKNNNLASDHIVSRVLLKLIENSKDEDVIQEAVKSLGEIAFGENKVISALKNLLKKYKQKSELTLEIANSLIKIQPHDSNAINTFFYFLLTPQKPFFKETVVKKLIEADRNNTNFIETLSYLLESSNKQESILLLYIAEILAKIDIGNSNKPIEVLIHLLDNATNEVLILNSAEILLEINVHQPKIVKALEKILKSSENIQVLLSAARLLGKIEPGNLEAINTLIELVYSCTPVASSYLEHMNLGKMKLKAIKALNKVMEVHEDELMRIWGAKSLGKIDTGNLRSVQTLLYFLKNGKDETIQVAAAKSLTSLLHTEQLKLMLHEIRDYFNQVRKNDSKSYKICQKVVWHCAKNLPYPDFYQAWHQPTIH